ncbi:MAG: biotin--[acetyl-CoA-carboxylase] ligase [bacterium]
MMRDLLKFKKVTSTQDVLKRFVKNKKELAAFAYAQTQGRGRHNREWFSPSGGIYLSILMFPPKHINSIPLIAALAVIECLKDLDFKDLSIHWPNDVMLNNKKICGILCEKIDNAVICGIGLNVNIKKFPARLSNATSLFAETGKVYELDKILNGLLEIFWELYDKLQADEFKFTEIYHYVSGLGESIAVKLSSRETIKGIIHNIDEDWGLLLRTEDGFIRKIYYGDVIRLS